MIKNNLWKIISFIGIVLSLIVILYLVVLYKVTWETKDFNTYLYFYDCNNVVCTSTTKPKNVKYNKIVCEDNECPYISNFMGNIIILTKNDISWLYDYKKGEVYNDEYINYELIDSGYFKVTDINSVQRILSKEGELLTQNKYNEIVDYNYGLVVYKEKGKYGIDYDSGEEVIPAKYNDIMLIDNTMYAALNNGKYQIYNVVNDAPKNNVKYDFVWSSGDVLIVVKDKQLDILNNRLESNLLMKIKTYFGYTKKSEIESLKIRLEDNFIYFNVNVNNMGYMGYKYDIMNKKISNNND